MIWEVGQDCRVTPTLRSGKTHVSTCPLGKNSSLLFAISSLISKTITNDISSVIHNDL